MLLLPIAYTFVFVFLAWLSKKYWYPVFDDLVKRGFPLFLHKITRSYNKVTNNYKIQMFELVSKEIAKHDGHIMEIGVGRGANFKYYPHNLPIKLTAVEPNNHCRKYFDEHLNKFDHVSLFKYVISKAEDMSVIPSNSIGCVISTIVLCSVDNQEKVLNEIYRILKPGSKFFFMEHVLAKDGVWYKPLQYLIKPIWKVIGDGCDITKDTAKVIKSSSNFNDVVINEFNAGFKGIFKLIEPHIWGYVEKSK